ncbi:hypothetical protein CTAYLR_004769 [Chrysophaeum taylorii]|uniref:DEAD/DEAH-box helicase domain-containing protein n=1 Tax=Chrysophaeum taylorii TaxID=2483200 RepID=A0AAD7UPB6_9STRA|nr:hypothetical protein CTAYLR_004769 [Chrysophaeum taylorii]
MRKAARDVVGVDDGARVVVPEREAMGGAGGFGGDDEVRSGVRWRPTYKIQAIAFGAMARGEHCIIADQTGSGKTLAYLLPLAQLRAEARGARLAEAPKGPPCRAQSCLPRRRSSWHKWRAWDVQ